MKDRSEETPSGEISEAEWMKMEKSQKMIAAAAAWKGRANELEEMLDKFLGNRQNWPASTRIKHLKDQFIGYRNKLKPETVSDVARALVESTNVETGAVNISADWLVRFRRALKNEEK